VTLRFDGMPARIAVPWEAVVAFFDSTAEFGLRFDMPGLAGAAAQRSGLAAVPPPGGAPVERNVTSPNDDAAPEREAADAAAEGGDDADGAKVLSFGRPRDRRGGD